MIAYLSKAKGDFTHEEYVALLHSLDQLAAKFANPAIRKRVVDALRISQSFRQGAWRRAQKESAKG
jgi:hypothetical protein